jgi:hypothetical protein
MALEEGVKMVSPSLAHDQMQEERARPIPPFQEVKFAENGVMTHVYFGDTSPSPVWTGQPSFDDVKELLKKAGTGGNCRATDNDGVPVGPRLRRKFAPILPVAPGRFSGTTGWP